MVEGWNQFWGAIDSRGGIGLTLAIIGGVIAVIAIIAWLFKGRRGGGISMSNFPWMLVMIAAICAAPKVVIPALLTILQAIVNIIVYLFQQFGHWLGG